MRLARRRHCRLNDVPWVAASPSRLLALLIGLLYLMRFPKLFAQPGLIVQYRIPGAIMGFTPSRALLINISFNEYNEYKL